MSKYESFDKENSIKKDLEEMFPTVKNFTLEDFDRTKIETILKLYPEKSDQ